MHPIDWLCAKAPEFKELPEEDRLAIMHFSLLCSFFESEVLNTNASAAAILGIVHEWAAQGRLGVAAFQESLSYFKGRYFTDGAETPHLKGLKLRKNDSPSLVEGILRGENTNSADSVSALLIIVYRLRNNLFHGAKWAYGIRGQLGNFTHANNALMSALEIHSQL
ncbi:MAG: hypothetical protein ROZ37_02095 [Aromatoleum sp.]|jgi:hypothetical protein|uniref:hypothetical protein n=1 Tax=Aromatoleum sp. TaxID=2307007 RepID=UPI002893E340|nr:hypothetical protein [Aromatoleum sp.]MDT3669104.1 hypothetical protein [Aromatoleum sp.]